MLLLECVERKSCLLNMILSIVLECRGYAIEGFLHIMCMVRVFLCGVSGRHVGCGSVATGMWWTRVHKGNRSCHLCRLSMCHFVGLFCCQVHSQSWRVEMFGWVVPECHGMGQWASLSLLACVATWVLLGMLQEGMQARPRLRTGSPSYWCGFDPQWFYSAPAGTNLRLRTGPAGLQEGDGGLV